MKHIFLMSFMLLVHFTYAQLSQEDGINFQGIARNENGSILANKQITIRLSIREGSETGLILYQEIKSVTTNVVGLFTIIIGANEFNRIVVIGNFSNINWGSSIKYLQVEVDPSNSIIFSLLGIQKINFVPYAFHSLSTEANNIKGIVPIENGGTGAATIQDYKLSLGINNVDNSSDLNKPISIVQQEALNNKLNYQDTISLSNRINLREYERNKSSNIVLDSSSNTMYPSVKAVKNYVDASIPVAVNYPISIINGGTGAINAVDARSNLGLVIGTDVLAQRTFGTAANSNIIDFEPAITNGLNSQYLRGDKSWQPLNTDVITEGANLYHTNTRSRASISLTNIGTSGASTYNNTTGVLNIPIYPIYTPESIVLSGDVAGSGTSSITTSIGSGKVMNDMLAGGIDLTSKVANILSIANGGTGASTKNFVDLSTAQTVTGRKSFDSTSANAFVKNGGTANQFLKANGTIDSNNYGIFFDTLNMQRNILRNASTGILTFGGLTLNLGLTAFNIGAVSGLIVDNTTSPNNPIITYVTYAGATEVVDPYALTSDMTYLLLNKFGNIIYQTTVPTTQQRRENIYLGKLTHTERDGFYVNAYTQADIVFSPGSQLRDIWEPIHLINGGVYPSANGSNLYINTSVGTIYGLGIGWSINTLSPSSFPVAAKTAATFKYRTRYGGISTYVNLIDPTRYDLNGVVTLVGTTTRATNQRIFLLQNGEIRVQYGQVYYTSLANAIAGIQTESFVTFQNFKDNGILIGVLSVRQNATDLSNITQAQFFLVSKFGELVGASSGVTTGNLQQAYNNSSIPQITTNTTNLAVTLQSGSSSDTDKVLDIKNGSAVSKFSVTGDGTVAANALTFGEKQMKVNFVACAAAGTIEAQSGNGITIAHTLGTGIYTFTFSESDFVLAPIVTTSLKSLGLIKTTSASNTITINTYDISGIATDLDFNLIAIFYK